MQIITIKLFLCRFCLQNSFNDLRKNLKHIKRIVSRCYESVLFLTIPPIPARDAKVNAQIKRINRFLTGWKQGNIQLCEICILSVLKEGVGVKICEVLCDGM